MRMLKYVMHASTAANTIRRPTQIPMTVLASSAVKLDPARRSESRRLSLRFECILTSFAQPESIRSLENLADVNGSIQPVQNSIEAIANLIYLARHAETHSAQQHRYIDSAARIIEELQHHPKLQE
jgi:hypothetical protein